MSQSPLRRPLGALAAAALVLSPALLLPSAALAEGDKDEKVAEREQVDQELEDLKIQLSDVNEDLAQTYLDLAETELLIPQAQEDLEDAQDELAAAREEDRETGERLDAAEDEEAELTAEVESGQQEVDRSDEELAAVALEAYKGGNTPNPATVYVGGTSPQDAVDRSVNYRLTMASQDSRLEQLRTDQAVTENSADRLTAVREEIDDLKAEAEAAVERKEEAEQTAADAKAELDDLYAQQSAQADDLEAKKTEYEDEQSDLEDRSSALDQEIADLVAEEKKREQQELAAQSSGDSGGSGSSTADGWVRPVDARLNSNFGWRVHPIYGTRKLHAGVDFPVACGVPVKAAHSGRVIQLTSGTAAGNKVILSHGTENGALITSSYHHLQSFAVSSGQSVEAGEVVGYVGTTGSSTGCHLHFETHRDGTAVNPANYI